MNEENATVFCLVEGPDKESCQACHLSAKNGTVCNIQEVEPIFLKTFMGEGRPINDDMTLMENGEPDPATRTIMVIDSDEYEVDSPTNEIEYEQLKNKVNQLITDSNGRLVANGSGEDFWISVFDSSEDAINCAGKLQLLYAGPSSGDNNAGGKLKIGISSGQPLTLKEGLFEDAMKLSQKLCLIARPGQIVLSSQLKEEHALVKEKTPYKILTARQEDFINELFDLTRENLHSGDLNVNTLSRLIGMSRPQLYRKVTELTGLTPKEFIHTIRMRKALGLIKNRNNNISEIAYNLGFSNPSHFSKVFREHFGHTPSQISA